MPAKNTAVTTTMSSRSRTPAHQLADLLLGDEGPLEDFVRERRAEGRSWRMIALDLYEELPELDRPIAGESLRGWFPDEPAEVAS